MRQIVKVVNFLAKKQKKVKEGTPLWEAYRTVLLDLCSQGLRINDIAMEALKHDRV